MQTYIAVSTASKQNLQNLCACMHYIKT